MRVLAPGVALTLGVAAWVAPASPLPRAQTTLARHWAHRTPPAADPLHLTRITSYADRATAPQLLGRSPFEFDHARAAGVAPRARRLAELPVPRAVSAPSAIESPPALAGIAEQIGPEGVVRTAVLTDLDGMVRFAVIGQVVGEVFRVSAIDVDRVTLLNARTGQTSQLVLK